MRPKFDRFKEAAAATGGNISRIAAIFNVSRTCVYSWMQDAKFRAVIDEERGRMVDELMDSARIAAAGIPIVTDDGQVIGWREKPDTQMLKYLLGTFGRREGFGREIDVTAKVISLDSLSDAQLDSLIQELTSKFRNEQPQEKL